MKRTAYISRLQDALGRRKLYWFGPRGADGRALLAIDQFDGAFSILSPLESIAVSYDVSIETLTSLRPDHNTYAFETEKPAVLREFRSRLLAALSAPSAILPYRPNQTLSNMCFPRSDTAIHLGLFHEHQSQFEHKPWVESELRRAGVRTLPWFYVSDEDRPRLVDFLRTHGQIVLRASRSDGGARVVLIGAAEELERLAPQHEDGFLSACKFFDRALPLNLNGCVFRDSTVVLTGLSEQLIGVPELTTRRFGYCGNVFRGSSDWPAELIRQFEKNALLTGRWLHSQGYAGVFGIDALWVDGQVYVVEVNPRFQGSTWALGRADLEIDRIDLYLLHLAVFLGLSSPPYEPLAEEAGARPASVQAVQHNVTGRAIHVTHDRVGETGMVVDLLPRRDTIVHPEAILARYLMAGTWDSAGPAILKEARRFEELAIKTE